MNRKPHIVVIMLDTLRADRLGCYGYWRSLSPNIDRLASQSTVFYNAITSAPWTLPSHASLFTGLFPFEHGAHDEHLYLDGNIPTLAQLLLDCGYRTAAYSTSNGWLSKSTGLMRGFEYLHDIPLASIKKKSSLSNRIKRRLLGYNQISEGGIAALQHHLTELKGQKPLFFFLNLMDTHLPYRPHKRFLNKYISGDTTEVELKYLADEFRTYRTIPEKLTERQLSLLNNLYDGCVSTADAKIGLLLDAISRQPDKENFLLVITADHGEHLGEHGLLNHWMSLYDILVRVPLIIQFPKDYGCSGIIKNQVQQLNLFYTLLEAAGFSDNEICGKQISEKSLLRMAKGLAPFSEYTFAQHVYPKMTLEHIRKYNPSFSNAYLESPKKMIRSNTYKLICCENGEHELFDLVGDAGETQNIFHQDNPTAGLLLKQMDNFVSAPVQSPKPEAEIKVDDFDPEVRKRLTDLGYL